jgi:tetratricopeptide (TPR) repeat protein
MKKLLFFNLGMAFLFLSSIFLYGKESGPVEKVIQSYLESDKLIETLSSAQKIVMRKDWLDALISITKEFPNDTATIRAYSLAIQLANATGEFSKGQEIIILSLKFYNNSPKDQIPLYMELGEICSRCYERSFKNNERLTAIASFEKANELLQQEYGVKLPREFLESYLLNLLRIRELKRDKNASLEEVDDSIKIAQKTRLLLNEIGTPQYALSGLVNYCSQELSIAKEGEDYARLDDLTQSVNVYFLLSQFSETKMLLSDYARLCVQKILHNNIEKKQKFLELWLTKIPSDSKTFLLKIELAQIYYNQPDKINEALILYENIIKNSVNDLLEYDGETLVQGKLSWYEVIMRNIRDIYLKKGDIEKSDEYNKVILDLAKEQHISRESNDMALYLQKLKDHTNQINYNKDNTFSMFRCMMFIIGCLFILVSIIILWKNKAK